MLQPGRLWVFSPQQLRLWTLFFVNMRQRHTPDAVDLALCGTHAKTHKMFIEVGKISNYAAWGRIIVGGGGGSVQFYRIRQDIVQSDIVPSGIYCRDNQSTAN